MLFLFFTHSIYSQIHYTITSDGVVSNVEKHILEYTILKVYDLDFNEYRESVATDFRISFNIEKSGTGKLVILWGIGNSDKEKFNYTIESCLEKTYNNSIDKYWRFRCISSKGIHKDVHLDLENMQVFIDSENNTRAYFSN